jgi:hypothetical protein
VKPPREFVLMDRAAIGLGSVFMHLKAEINWHQPVPRPDRDFDAKALAASPPSPWSCCRASPAPSRWTCSPRQANLAGYKAVIDAAAVYGRAFPMMMTAAGTVRRPRCW